MATTKKAIAEAEQAAEIKETIAAPTTEPGTPAVTLDELESMDMNMFDAEETESAPRPAWRITDDGCAGLFCGQRQMAKFDIPEIVINRRRKDRARPDHRTGRKPDREDPAENRRCSAQI